MNAAAEAGTAANSSPLTGQQIGQYLSPYLNEVLGSTSQLLNQNNQQAQAGQLGDAIRSGAFGGDRTGIAAANLNQQQQLANANILSGIANQGYQSALSTAQGQQQIGLAGAKQLADIGQTAYGEGANTSAQLADLGAGAQSAALQGANAQIAAGTVQQQTQQAQDTALYQQFLQAQSYPFQTLQQEANIAEGTGALSGSTTTTTQPGGFFSDERLKEGMEVIGKTFDGQPIYRYRMKGDPREQIGLSAQKVEKKHPEAVGLAGGFKFVDYGRATEEAANRGRFYEGGVVPFPRRRFADGGYSGGLDAVLEAQRNMYAPQGNSQRNIPSTGASHQLAVAQGTPAPPPSGASNVQTSIGLGKDAYQAGKWAYNKWNTPSAQSGWGQPVSANALPSNMTYSQYQQALNASEPTGLSPAGVQPSGAISYGAGDPAEATSIAPLTSTAPDTAGLGAADTGAADAAATGAASGAAAEGAADAGAGAAASAAGSAAAAGATDAAVAGATDAAATEAAALAAEYAAADAAAYGAAALSDKRAKEGIEAVGKTFDGQTIYRYRLKGESKEQIGLLAQEVEKKHPNAVGSVGGLKVVNYGLATAQAAKRGERYSGGRIGLAAGGSPYSDPEGQLDIPDEEVSNEHLQSPGPLVKQKTGLQTLEYMGQPNNAMTIGGDMFSNQALARGGLAGRRGYDDGGATDDDSTPASTLASTPAVANDPDQPTGVAPPTDAPWWKKSENILPILSGLAAMGTARTVHPGVALAAGLGAGAESYLNTRKTQADIQQTQAKTTGLGISNRLNAATTQAAIDAISAPQGQPTQATPRATDPNASAAAIDQDVRNTYQVPPITADETNYLNRMAALSAATKNPQWEQMAKTRIAARVDAQTFSNQQAAQHEAAALLSVMNDPNQSDVVRKAATARYNAVSAPQWTGAKIEDVGGSLRYSTTGQPTAGAQAQTLTPQQQAQIQLEEARPVDTGAAAKVPLRQFAQDTGSTIPPAGGAVAATSTPSKSPKAPSVPPQDKTSAAYDFSGAPTKPTWLDNPYHVLTPSQKTYSDAYAAKDVELRDEANQLKQTQLEQIKVQRALNLLPNAKTGPGTDTMSAIQTALGNMTGSQFTTWLDSNPAAHAILTKSLGQQALDDRLREMKGAGAAVRLGAQQDNLILNKLSASTEMPKASIEGLLRWDLQESAAKTARQKAIPAYLDRYGGNALGFDNYWSTAHPMSSYLTTTPPAGTTLPHFQIVQPKAIASKADYDALPSGTVYTWQGRRGIKP